MSIAFTVPSPSRRPLALALGAILALGVVQAHAAEPAESAAGADADAKTLDRVTVSGERLQRDRSTTTRLPITVRQTPQSISVVDAQQLQEQSLFDIDEVMRNIPGVNVSFYDTQRPLYYARGFQITDFQVDGLPTYSGNTNQEYDTAFYDRIEVIRGANGLLSGTGVPSATVNLFRKRPGKEFDASFAVSAGSWDYRRMQADVNAPLTHDGRFRARAVAAYEDRDYYYDRYHEQKSAAMAVLEGDLTESTTLTVGYQMQDNKPVGSTWGTVPFFFSDGSEADLSRATNLAPNWTRWQRETRTAYVQLEQQFGDHWNLKVNYARTEGDVTSVRVYGSGFPDRQDGSGVYLQTGVGQSRDTRDAVDAYLGGKFFLFGREHDAVIGASWQDLETITPTLATQYPADWDTCEFGRCYWVPNLYDWNGVISVPTFSRTGAWRQARTTQSGLYASTRLRLAEPLALIAGARLSRWSTRTHGFNAAGNFTGTTGVYKVDDELTPYLGLMYDIVPDVSVYASYTEIFNPQNYKDKNDNLLDPVQGSNREIGLKAAFLDGRITTNAAVFEARQDNYAMLDASVPQGSLPDGSSAYLGVDGTKSRGWEAEVGAEVLPGWRINAAYTRAKVTRASTDLIYANLPLHTVQFSTQWNLPGAWERLSLGANVMWQSEVEGFNIENPVHGLVTVKQDAYALVSFNANYRITDQWTATLAVRNAFDETYWANLDYNNYGEPRFVAFTLRWKY
ncbi:MAG TPA: TonB-dependent siderophore receptor [Stenotrophomonas sp.]|jgi:outer membrane receptor for ferric coprogen and ferric-rhodotorulic acid